MLSLFDCRVHVQAIYSIMDGTVFVNACHFVPVSTSYFQLHIYKVLHYQTMQVTPVPKTKLLLSSMWDVIWVLDIQYANDRVMNEWFVWLYTVYSKCVCLYGCEHVCVDLWIVNLTKQHFYRVTHYVYLLIISTCYELNKNKADGKFTESFGFSFSCSCTVTFCGGFATLIDTTTALILLFLHLFLTFNNKM